MSAKKSRSEIEQMVERQARDEAVDGILAERETPADMELDQRVSKGRGAGTKGGVIGDSGIIGDSGWR